MNKIICDNQECKAEIKPVIESKHLTGGIRINYFRCNSCRTKHLVDVTDQATREKQIEAMELTGERLKILSKVIDNIGEETIKEKTQRLTELDNGYMFNIQRLDNEIKVSKAELKIKYEGEL